MKRMRSAFTALLVAGSALTAITVADPASAAPLPAVAAQPAPAAPLPGPAPVARQGWMAYGSFNVFQTWTMRGARVYSIDKGPHAGQCTVSASILVQEIGKHGVVRLKIDFELRGPNAPGWTGWVLHTGLYPTDFFPDDGRSFHHTFQLNAGGFRFPPNLTFSLWIKTVGERYGFPDYSRHYKLADVSCNSSTPSIDFHT